MIILSKYKPAFCTALVSVLWMIITFFFYQYWKIGFIVSIGVFAGIGFSSCTNVFYLWLCADNEQHRRPARRHSEWR